MRRTIVSLLRNLLSPEKPSAKTLAELTAVLKRHFAPKRVVIAERFRFYRREQAIGANVADYEAELRRLATHCEFGEYLDQALRDRLVSGLRSEATDLTLKRALEIAQSQEAAERNTQQLKAGNTSTLNVESVSVSSKRECHRCGGRNHLPWECRCHRRE